MSVPSVITVENGEVTDIIKGSQPVLKHLRDLADNQ